VFGVVRGRIELPTSGFSVPFRPCRLVPADDGWCCLVRASQIAVSSGDGWYHLFMGGSVEDRVEVLPAASL